MCQFHVNKKNHTAFHAENVSLFGPQPTKHERLFVNDLVYSSDDKKTEVDKTEVDKSNLMIIFLACSQLKHRIAPCNI
jgi:hypothetical protein